MDGSFAMNGENLIGFSNSEGNRLVHVAAASQLILLYMFLCVWRALTRPPNTQKHSLQRGVACGDRKDLVWLLLGRRPSNNHTNHILIFVGRQRRKRTSDHYL